MKELRLPKGVEGFGHGHGAWEPYPSLSDACLSTVVS